MSFLAKQPPDFEAAKRIYTEVFSEEKNLQYKGQFSIQGGNSGKTTEIKLEVRLKKDFPAGSLVTQMNSETVRMTFL